MPEGNIGDRVMASGYIVIVDWVSHAPMVDGVQITFQDGATSNVEFVEEILTEINFNAKDVVLFTGAVYRDEFPAPANRTDVNDVALVALLSGETVCSNRVAVEYRQAPSTEPRWLRPGCPAGRTLPDR